MYFFLIFRFWLLHEQFSLAIARKGAFAAPTSPAALIYDARRR